MAQVFREQRAEMQSTFVAIRQKIADAQVATRNLNAKAKRCEEEKAEADQRFGAAHSKCIELREQITDRERDLSDVENQVPLAKSKMHELESALGENKHFERILQQTRREVEELQKRKEAMHVKAKQRAEDCWQATQKLHRLEVSVEEAEKKIDFCTRRIIVARERLAAVDAQTQTVSMNYQQASKNEMENKFVEMQAKVSAAKERRRKIEEEEKHLTWEIEEKEMELKTYQQKVRDMFDGQRELASSKLL